ncbi:hypothetical protein SPRG_10755 [Saprolegnia parasitica CBS 223.65]|uniref:CBM1 domain-containing protein n=1 Tax=Saprolegnia parasitica (strain CBS 223.65) TaxID=695850 RepID=A0A067C9R9_SAPPC|nr:hypothetical protein SPRG_10755 [Saprolegnia parasitica CBS 223.65]KDO23562.1 hypothetical protein SPRG_10755 [Saprolegnia parasitica CBS 223.65]|eukprot:XP_012205712.1 hypothetical protein SPRG_10755 [Saprolegnia parasitica CBS 223.65]
MKLFLALALAVLVAANEDCACLDGQCQSGKCVGCNMQSAEGGYCFNDVDKDSCVAWGKPYVACYLDSPDTPTESPTAAPTEEPSSDPSPAPSDEPSDAPTEAPTDDCACIDGQCNNNQCVGCNMQSAEGGYCFSDVDKDSCVAWGTPYVACYLDGPAPKPGPSPTVAPTKKPSPSDEPSDEPSDKPSDAPTDAPTGDCSCTDGQCNNNKCVGCNMLGSDGGFCFNDVDKDSCVAWGQPYVACYLDTPSQQPTPAPTPAPSSDPTFAPTSAPSSNDCVCLDGDGCQNDVCVGCNMQDPHNAGNYCFSDVTQDNCVGWGKPFTWCASSR